MNSDKVYLCDIHQLMNVKYNDENVQINKSEGFSLDNFLRIRRESVYVKRALVYYSEIHRRYIDLETKDRYRFGYGGCAIGDYYIDSRVGLRSVSELINCRSKNMSKRRILKKYKEVEDGGRKE